jgi:hypothetical protein
MNGTLWIVSTLLTVVGLAHRPGERRLGPRVAALPLQALHEPGLLAADVGAGAPVEVDLAREVRAEDLLPDQLGRARLGDRGLEALRRRAVLAAHVDVDGAGADRVGGD